MTWEEDEDLGLVPVPFRTCATGRSSSCRTALDRPIGDADDSGESSPSTSMATMSLPAGEDMAHSGEVVSVEVVRCGATSSNGALAVRCEATYSGGAMVVLTWAKTSWADGLRVESSKDD
jgi:hypothetical protein